MKINVSLDEKLLERISTYADNNYMSRSGFISLACTQFLNQAEVVMCVKNMSLAMQKIADTGTLDAEAMQQLEDFERISKMLVTG